jgi:hypothetical protein
MHGSQTPELFTIKPQEEESTSALYGFGCYLMTDPFAPDGSTGVKKSHSTGHLELTKAFQRHSFS